MAIYIVCAINFIILVYDDGTIKQDFFINVMAYVVDVKCSDIRYENTELFAIDKFNEEGNIPGRKFTS